MEQRRNSGVLFSNAGKRPGTRRPDFLGRINIGGSEFKLAAWKNRGAYGEYIGITVEDAGGDAGGGTLAGLSAARATFARLMMVHHPDRGGDAEVARALIELWTAVQTDARARV